jgi:hypothetical protein
VRVPGWCAVAFCAACAPVLAQTPASAYGPATPVHTLTARDICVEVWRAATLAGLDPGPKGTVTTCLFTGDTQQKLNKAVMSGIVMRCAGEADDADALWRDTLRRCVNQHVATLLP